MKTTTLPSSGATTTHKLIVHCSCGRTTSMHIDGTVTLLNLRCGCRLDCGARRPT
jgi:hypothetical protein